MEFGGEGYTNFVRKFGRIDGAAATPTIVWDGTTPYEGWLPSEEFITIVSDSGEDQAGGDGGTHVILTGQGEDGIEKSYILPLNGTTPVNINDIDPGVKFDIIYTAQFFNLDSPNPNLSPTVDPANRGNITISSLSGKTMAVIKAGLGRTQMMIWRCPADKYAEFNKVSIYPDANKPVLAQIWARDSKKSSWVVVGQIDIQDSIASITHPFPDYISPGTDICLVVVPEQTNTNISAQMWIEKKDIENYDELKEEGEI